MIPAGAVESVVKKADHDARVTLVSQVLTSVEAVSKRPITQTTTYTKFAYEIGVLLP